MQANVLQPNRIYNQSFHLVAQIHWTWALKIYVSYIKMWIKLLCFQMFWNINMAIRALQQK